MKKRPFKQTSGGCYKNTLEYFAVLWSVPCCDRSADYAMQNAAIRGIMENPVVVGLFRDKKDDNVTAIFLPGPAQTSVLDSLDRTILFAVFP